MKIDLSKFTDPMVVHGIDLMKDIVSQGYEAYIVGGTVRDIAMGSTNIHDIDISTNMPIEEIKKRYRTVEYGGGEKHGTVIVRYMSNDFELTQFRADGEYSDGRRPDSVEFVKDFKTDTARRDFTINSMGLDCEGNVIDHHGGVEDIEKKVLRTVGDPEARLSEDRLRIIRAMRFFARFKYHVPADVMAAVNKLKHGIPETVAVERIRDELQSTIGYGGTVFADALMFMYETELMPIICPKIDLTMKKIGYVRSADTKDEIVNFTLLCYDHLPRLEAIKDGLKLDNRVLSGMAFIIKNLDKYPKLASIDKETAVKIVSDRDFDRLRTVYRAIAGHDVPDIESHIESIKSLAPVVAMGTDISNIIKETVTPGPDFGKIKNAVLDTLYGMLLNEGKTPTEETIRSVVKSILDKRNAQ